MFKNAKFPLLLLVCTSVTTMRRGPRMNPIKWLPRDPSRCVLIRVLWVKLGSHCNDPDCLENDCPRWAPYDPKTGKRVRPWPKRVGLNAVIELWSDLSRLSQMMSTKKPPRSANLKPNIVGFTVFASCSLVLLCIIPCLATILKKLLQCNLT